MTVVTGKEQKGVCKVSECDLHTLTKCTSLPSLTAAVLQLAVLVECALLTLTQQNTQPDVITSTIGFNFFFAVKSSPLLKEGINNH